MQLRARLCSMISTAAMWYSMTTAPTHHCYYSIIIIITKAYTGQLNSFTQLRARLVLHDNSRNNVVLHDHGGNCEGYRIKYPL
jgi:hypothetical protein